MHIYQSYKKQNRKSSSRIHKKLRKYNELLEQFSGDKEKMMAWGKAEAKKETALYNQQRERISVTFSQTARIPLKIKRIAEEAMYDGFYAVITNLEDNPAKIIKINKQRWEIEENCRIMIMIYNINQVNFQCEPSVANRQSTSKIDCQYL